MSHTFVQSCGLYEMRPRLLFRVLTLGLIKTRNVEICSDIEDPEMLFLEFDCNCHNSSRGNRCWIEIGWTEWLFYEFRKVSENSTSLDFSETCHWCQERLPEGCGGLWINIDECRLEKKE